jgi:hypothetical protein
VAILICLLPAVVLTNTGYKLIILELRKNSSGQINSIQNHFQFKLFVCFLSDINQRFNKSFRELFLKIPISEEAAARIALSRFRSILDSRGLNSVVLLSGSNPPEFIILSEFSSG